MKIHHLNCGTLCPRMAIATGLFPHELVCHCLLIEAPRGLVLLDTGIGLLDPRRMPSFARASMLGPGKPDPKERAAEQIRALGYRTDDVRHILVTHLDYDHAGGFVDFPNATIHLYERELAAATAPRSLIEKLRYHPIQWAHKPHWKPHRLAGPPSGEKWFDFEGVHLLDDLGIEAYLIPFVGHTRGHSAFAIRHRERWLLHCGDGYFHPNEIHANPPRCPKGLRLFQWSIQVDGAARVRNQEALRQLVAAQGEKVQVFCSHNPMEWKRAVEANGLASEVQISAAAGQPGRHESDGRDPPS